MGEINNLHHSMEKVVETPAILLGKAIDGTKEFTQNINKKTTVKKIHRYWNTLGPGLITGAADDDPSGITTYSQAGAQYGSQLLWLAGFTFPFMAIVQEMCARIGLVTGRGLAGVIRVNYPRWVLYVVTILLFIANTLNLGVDIGAMAKAIQLITPDSPFFVLVIIITLFSLFLQIFTSYKTYAKYLKWLALILLSYVFSAMIVKMDIREMLIGAIIPSITFSKEQVVLICGVLGTTISPYLFFWQTSQEVEEEILKGNTTIKSRIEAKPSEVKNMRIDVWSGMFFSNLVMFFIIASCAATLNYYGITNIDSAADAAMALRPIAGDATYFLFALGIIGTGLLAVPVLAGSAAYALSESFRWKEGLYRKLKDAYSFYGIIILSMGIGLLINFIGLDPIKALIYSAVFNGLIAPIILILIIQISSNEKIMGKWRNHSLITLMGWFITGLMTVTAAATIYSLFFG
jgi:NRAMP (natural resistance-associated macrophage protein)-like metal ion transporter